MLLEAVAGTRIVGCAYAAALRRGYLWHEFGHSCLLLPGRPARVERGDVAVDALRHSSR